MLEKLWQKKKKDRRKNWRRKGKQENRRLSIAQKKENRGKEAVRDSDCVANVIFSNFK